MKKEAFVLLTFLALIPFITAQTIDVPIQKITHYAEEYEIGNINYAQLVVYISSLKQDIAEAMGAIGEEHEPSLKLEQLEASLGKPQEYTKWAWAETGDGNGYDKKLDNEAPGWRKIIFDGKIQIWLNAWPNIITRNNKDILVYRLHLDIRFKSPEEQTNIKEKIEEINSLAEGYSKNPTEENLETLAKESVTVEQSFNNYFNQNPANCEELMSELFGSENKRDNQKLLAEEIDFFEGDNFEAVIRLEMCDDCKWNWINLDMWFESRGRFEHPEDVRDYNGNSREKFSKFSSENFKAQTATLIEEMKNQIESGNYKSALEKSQELRILTEAWNEKSNNVWEELEDKFKVDFESMTEEERQKCHENYCWIKKEQERKEAEKVLRNKNYEERKQFYLNLFSNYEKKEFYYEQEEWEKRLVEEFKDFGEEMCSNNVDDNNDEKIDCSDSQCGGKFCGYDTVVITNSNETREEKIELSCIAGTCQAKEEIIKEEIIVCGNHICEENEQESCLEDCTTCFQHKPLECSGHVFFSGEDERGCPLEPTCLSEDISCETDEDCVDPLCGDALCIKGTCQITQLIECREAECVDGDEKVQHCESGEERIIEKCVDGLWREIGVKCETLSEGEKKTVEEVVGKVCVVKSDCGNENDVCSNGKCVTLPEISDVQEKDGILERENEVEEEVRGEPQESPELPPEPESTLEPAQESPESIVTGEVIFSFFRTLASKMEIIGFVGEEGDDTNRGETNIGKDNPDNSREEITNEQNENFEDFPKEDFEDERDEREDRDRVEKGRREGECRERCDRECYERKVRPCVEDCIREQCGNELECNIEDVKATCENECKTENNIESCKNECSDKCLAGEETWQEPEREEHKQEKFVFTIGGSCRKAQGKTETFIWFGGWGDDFNDFHLIKNKYYSRGGGDWCEDDLENLIKQRKELEKSLNQEFASWFFEKYVANSADDWEKHISGIFELYWRDVDISRQMVERLQCLRKNSLPENNLINLKYETEYGGVEFWEEIKTTKIHEDGKEMQIISPYMKIWLFPSRDFFKAKMRRAMENHELPGSSEEEKRNTLSEEEKRELKADNEFMKNIRNFNSNYGESIVIQFKDLETNEVAFNLYVKINEDDIMYFEPMPPAENPSENVKVELDVDKFLDIVEYEEQGRVELESPPWDRQPRTGFVKGAVDGVRMFFMFRSLINSADVTPESAEKDVLFFVRNFFEVVGDNDREEVGGIEGPGGCQGEKECREYCEDPENREECMQFRNRELPEDWENREALTGEIIKE